MSVFFPYELCLHEGQSVCELSSHLERHAVGKNVLLPELPLPCLYYVCIPTEWWAGEA